MNKFLYYGTVVFLILAVFSAVVFATYSFGAFVAFSWDTAVWPIWLRFLVGLTTLWFARAAVNSIADILE